ncbi:hypothetical protein ACFVSX_23305 [Streptomyces rubiginosohelvolus]|uniref:hypothetical protein n=1 Tax=Streptomyces rubiginosohelvolus TaxID=67362 RepID=UPI0036DE4F9F
MESEWNLTGGMWVPHADGREVSGGGSPDIDHMMPLAEDPAHHAPVGVVDVSPSR